MEQEHTTGFDTNSGKEVVDMTTKIKKHFDILITDENNTYSQTFELDKTIAFVRGILMTSTRDELMYIRGAQKIEINRLEVFPEGYESKLLMTGINCPMNMRYYDTGKLPIGNAQVKLTYKDTHDDRIEFAPYIVRINLDCELLH
ncbi:MAG: hypothetical protein ACHQD8_01360 [Chitinophagales bacterium]